MLTLTDIQYVLPKGKLGLAVVFVLTLSHMSQPGAQSGEQTECCLFDIDAGD